MSYEFNFMNFTTFQFMNIEFADIVQLRGWRERSPRQIKESLPKALCMRVN